MYVYTYIYIYIYMHTHTICIYIYIYILGGLALHRAALQHPEAQRGRSLRLI